MSHHRVGFDLIFLFTFLCSTNNNLFQFDFTGESLKQLLKSCPKIKKLFLAAIRGLTDRDLEAIANLCPDLEQLDLLGVMGISTEKCYL